MIVFDNASYFSSLKLYEFDLDKGIILIYYSYYYPQGNGLAEATNKVLVSIIKKIVQEKQKNWKNALHNSLWVDRVTPKVALGVLPYYIVYGQESILPSYMILPSLPLSLESSTDQLSMLEERLNTLILL